MESGTSHARKVTAARVRVYLLRQGTYVCLHDINFIRVLAQALGRLIRHSLQISSRLCKCGFSPLYIQLLFLGLLLQAIKLFPSLLCFLGLQP